MKIYRKSNILDDIDSIEENQLLLLLHNQNIPFKNRGDILFAQINNNKYYFEKIFDEYEPINEICNYISNLSMGNALEMLQINEDDIYSDVLEGNIKSLKNNLDKVYHWTTEEKWEAIQSSGYLNPSYGTGINNRNAFGIFSTTNSEEYQDGVYGDVLLEIDVGSFRENVEDIEISMEPEIIEYYVKNTIAHVLNADCFFDHPQDISPYTLILNHKVPLQYVKEIT